MTGAGGGSLMIPLLNSSVRHSSGHTVGTDLFYAAATKMGGTLFDRLGRTVEWRVVTLLVSGSVPPTALTLFVWAVRARVGRIFAADGPTPVHAGLRE
jgi:uncharacterized membrane protein YfcA